MWRRSSILLPLFIAWYLFVADVPAWHASGRDREFHLGGQGAAFAAGLPLSATDDALAKANAALTALLQLAQAPTLPTSNEVQTVLNQLESALALDSTIAPGNLGWALTRLLLLAADAQERFGPVLGASMEQGLTPESLFSLRPLLKAARADTILSAASWSALVKAFAQHQLPAGDVDEMQNYLIGTALPALEAVKDHLDKAILDTAHIPFAVRDGTGSVVFMIDRGDLYLSKAAASVLTAAVYLTVAYHLEPGSFDPLATLGCCSAIYSDGVVTRQEYLPPSPFMTRYSQSHWTAMLNSLGEAVPAVESGVITGNHGAGPYDPVNPSDPETAQALADLGQFAAMLKLGLLGPVSVSVSTPSGDVPVRVDITAWKTRLPSDLKTLFPKFNSNWEILLVPDTTFAGLFPDGDYPLTELNEGLVGLLEGLFGVPLGESGPEVNPPSVGIWSLWPGAVIRGTVSVRGDASDDHCLQQVRIYVDAALVATLPACLPWFEFNWSWNTSSLANGSHELKVSATDRASPAHTSYTIVNVTVDNTLPTVSLTSPANGSIVRGVVPVSATASDNLGLQHVQFYVRGQLAYTDVTAPFGFNWNTTTSPEGPITLMARAVDRAGGTRDSAVTVNVDNLLFDDVPASSSYLPYVTALFNADITGGCYYNATTGERRFCLLASVTRAEMAVFLCKAAGKAPLNRDTPTFADVPKTHWGYGFVERLADAASWNGKPPTGGCRVEGSSKYFCPGNLVTREQMAKFLCLAAAKAPMPSCSGKFTDVGPSSAFCPFIERLTDAPSWPGGTAVTSGCGCPPSFPPEAKCYCPSSNVTRAQMAIFLVRAFNLALP